MKIIKLVTALIMLTSTVALAGDTITLRDVKTGAEYGPVSVVNGERIKVGETTLEVTVVEQTLAQKTLQKKSKSIVLPKLEIKESDLQHAVGFFKHMAKKHDPDQKGVNILLMLPSGEPTAQPKLTLELSNTSLYDTLRYCCEATGLRMRVDDNAIVLSP